MNKPRILVDADSCPAAVKNVILKAAVRLELEVYYFANRNIPFSLSSTSFHMIIAENSANAADDLIVNQSLEDDIIITRDIPLAQRLVEKNLTVMNDRGTLFNRDNVEKMLRQRELNLQLVMAGIHMGNKVPSFGKEELHQFSACFDQILQKKMAAWKKTATMN